jgi:transcriptional regulator with XRE-family HTH domain
MSGAHDPRYIEFIARLRNARKAKNLSQKDFGDLITKPQSFVSKVETCERRLDVIEAAEWCVALGIRLEDALPPSVKKALQDAVGKGQ